MQSEANPNVTRSRLVLEIASEMIGRDKPRENPDYYQAKIVLRPGASPTAGKGVTLFGSSTAEGIYAVANREVDVAIINPACVASVAALGKGIFKNPIPLRAIAVIPSWDQMVFAVHAKTGLKTFEEIAEKRYPLRVSMRGMPEHTLHHMFDDVAAAAGFSRDDIKKWGGEVVKEGGLAYPDAPKFGQLVRGEIDAIFDEASQFWVNEAMDEGVTMLTLAESTVKKLEAMGYRRAIMPQSVFKKLPADVLTIDFSGWTVFCHAETDDKVVTDICAALEARKARIPWEEPGAIPTERMARETPDTPQVIPLHPAAERYWRKLGYI